MQSDSTSVHTHWHLHVSPASTSRSNCHVIALLQVSHHILLFFLCEPLPAAGYTVTSQNNNKSKKDVGSL